MKKSFAISAINKHGMLLVFPIDNKKAPLSLWSVAYPKTKMRWEWDDSGDDRVSSLWFLREQLSKSGEVIYTKWYRGRATLFSKPVFTAILASFIHEPSFQRSLSQKAKEILQTLEGESPLSTRELKRITGLQGKKEEPAYNKGMKELWSRCLITAFGEVDEGAFPSLAMGATCVLFEDLYKEAKKFDQKKARKILSDFFLGSPEAEKFYQQVKKSFTVTEKTKGAKLPEYVDFERDFNTSRSRR